MEGGPLISSRWVGRASPLEVPADSVGSTGVAKAELQAPVPPLGLSPSVVSVFVFTRGV